MGQIKIIWLNKRFGRNISGQFVNSQGNTPAFSISEVSINPVSQSSFNVFATVDTKEIDALVSVEYGLTTDYGFETIPIPVNGIVNINLLLNL